MDALIALSLGISREIAGLPGEMGVALETGRLIGGPDRDLEKIHIEAGEGVTGTHHHQEVDTLGVRTGIDLGVEAIMLLGMVGEEAGVARDEKTN